MSVNQASDAIFTIGHLRAAYASGVSAVEVVDIAYDRIERHADNPVWIELVPRTDALARAAALSVTARSALPLWGVPFAVKDNIDVAGMPTTAGCPEFAYLPTSNAPAVQRLIDAGAICLGKTNLDQFATGLVGTRSPYGACRNVFDARFISGGSSSGSAVALALGCVAFSIGTDTAGSGRVPAAFNNVVGLKPTRGAISTRGVVPACRSLDCVSIFANDCADAMTVLKAVRAYDPLDPFSRRAVCPGATPGERCFGIPRANQREFFGDREYQRLFEDAIARLCALRFEPKEVDYAPFLETQRLLYEGPWLAERLAAIDDFTLVHRRALHPVIRDILDRAAPLSAVDAYKGAYRLAELGRAVEPLWEQVSLLMLPAAPTVYTIDAVASNPLELNARLGLYTNFVNLLDLAAINVPAGFRSDGLPFGVSLIGRAHSEDLLANVGGRLHAALGQPSGVMPNAYPAAPPAAPAGKIKLAVVGAHLSGLPLNAQLTERRARLLGSAKTARVYRLYALDEGAVPRPGMVRVGGEADGGAIEAEVWELGTFEFGSFVADVTPPLGIGTVELEGGERVKGFLCEQYAVQGKTDITDWGGWRRWLDHVNVNRAHG